MTAPEQRVIVLGRKVKAQRRQLRQLQRAHNLNAAMWREAVRQNQHDRRYWAEQAKREVDYRSACKCWACRVREWYRYRSGETYPSQKHPRFRLRWRFPGHAVWLRNPTLGNNGWKLWPYWR